MPRAGRAFDTAQPATAGDGGQAARSEASPVSLASPDVIIDNQAALRSGDAGPGFRASGGSTGVFVDGLPAFRQGDATVHDRGPGELVQGSPDVIIGDRRPGAPRERPHDRSVALDVTDALRRPVHGVAVHVSCPHQQRAAETVDGATNLGGLCRASTVTVDKALQIGTWDAGASHGAHPQATTREALDAPIARASSIASNGGTPAPSDAAPHVVHAPAPSATSSGGVGLSIPAATGPTQVVLPTAHNWVELVYEAFGQHLPTGPKELALLGVRGASLAPAVPTAKTPEGSLEVEAARGELADVAFTTGAHVATAYSDLLFCVWTDASVHHTQHVDVFECSIDASPGQGELHLPFLLEGKLFHAEPASVPHYPGSDVALRVFEGKHEAAPPQQPTAEAVIALAMTQRGITESPPGSNLVKYGAWYGDNGEPWCAMFVSWCFAHAGMPLIHYAYCPYGAGYFQSGEYGTWYDAEAHAEPGDVVFYQFNGPSYAATQLERNAVLDHTGIVVHDDGSYITTVEGNTSAPGGSGSQSDGGGVFLKTRPKDDLIAGFGRPKYPAPVKVPTSFIRWGSEASSIGGTSRVGSTLLHHHYFRAEHKKQVPDPAATRYRQFMDVYNQAKNKDAIPYLIVSSRYVETYEEWVTRLADHPTQKPAPSSVILASGLVSPEGIAGHYLPSFMSKAYADGVLKHAGEMHDKKAAASLRDVLLGSLMSVPKSSIKSG
jgi:uncharacterized Zn-binding protein involved in type VI secretion